MLTLENISFYRNDNKIFERLSYTLSISSALIITGKNGSGKSSLLKIIAGLYPLESGNILWGNENIKNFRNDFNGDLQYIGHKNFLKNNLTILENLKFFSKIHDTELSINFALNYFDLKNIQNIAIKNLSAGMKQRVLLAKLLCCPASIWLLDEPSTHLDNIQKEKLHGLIKTRIKDKGMVILTTHDAMFFDLGPKLNLEDFA
jgi:heme exporter protein A